MNHFRLLSTPIRVALGILVLTVSLAMLPAVARAHSFPEQETPSAGQVLTSPPSAVTIKFDAPIEQLFAHVKVVGADGANRAIGSPALSADHRTLSIKVGSLAPGVYTVKWSVVCIDTHHTTGSFIFTVKGQGA